MVEEASRRRVLTIVGAVLAVSLLINLSGHLDNWVGVAIVAVTVAVAAPLMHFHERRSRADAAYERSDRWRRDRTRIIIVFALGAALYLLALVLFT